MRGPARSCDAVLKGHRGAVWCVAACGSGAASGAAGRTIRVWARQIDSARATRRVMQPRALGNAVPFLGFALAGGSRAWLRAEDPCDGPNRTAFALLTIVVE